MRTVYTYFAAVIRIDEIWLATEPLDMRVGARIVQVFGSVLVD